jgi:peptidoglycan hydrolase CwlO-like protein
MVLSFCLLQLGFSGDSRALKLRIIALQEKTIIAGRSWSQSPFFSVSCRYLLTSLKHNQATYHICSFPNTLDAQSVIFQSMQKGNWRLEKMPQLVVVKFSGFLLIALGVIVAIASIVVYPMGSSVIDTLQTTSSTYLDQASSMVSNSQDLITSAQTAINRASATINSALTDLGTSADLIASAQSTLNSVGSSIGTIGASFSALSIQGQNPLSSVGNQITSLGTPIQAISTNLQGIASKINDMKQQGTSVSSELASIGSQLGQLKDSLDQLKNTLGQTKDSLPSYFIEAKLAFLLVITGFVGLGVVLVVSGISILSLRKSLIETNTKLENMKPPST